MKIIPIIFRSIQHVKEEIDKIKEAAIPNYSKRIAACLLSLWKWEQNKINKKGRYNLGDQHNDCGLCKITDIRGRDFCCVCPLYEVEGLVCGLEDSSYKIAIGSYDYSKEESRRKNKQPLINNLEIATAREIAKEVITRSTASVVSELKELQEVFEEI